MRKRILLLLLVVFASRSLIAQTYVYNFINDLTESGGIGPTLVEDFDAACGGTAGAFSSQSIATSCASPTQPAFNFTDGGGLVFTNPGNVIGSTYTIHMIFKFTAYTGQSYQRILDFSNSTQDDGIYANNDCGTIPGGTYEGGCNVFVDGQWNLLTLTRDGTNDSVKLYIDGVIYERYEDLGGAYIPTAGPIKLFRDEDNGCENGPGSIRYLQISNVLDDEANVGIAFSNICALVLPLQLLDFAAIKQNNSVLLKWATETEVNTSHFELERSANGRSFDRITNVTAANNPNIRNNYSFTDAQPLQGTSFYRLKMVDLDGHFKYSNVLKISFGTVTKFEVFPNPAKESVTVSGIQGNQTIKVINAHGVQMNQLRTTGQSMTLDLRKYPSGIYIVVYSDGEKVQQLKIVKE